MNMQLVIMFVSNAFSACWDWLRQIFDATGAIPYYLAGLVFFFFVQMVLLPLRGGRMFSLGSDIAGIMRHSESSHPKGGSHSKGG